MTTEAFSQSEIGLRMRDGFRLWALGLLLFFIVVGWAGPHMRASSVGVEALKQMALLAMMACAGLAASVAPFVGFAWFPSARRQGLQPRINLNNFNQQPVGRDPGNLVLRLPHPAGAGRVLLFLFGIPLSFILLGWCLGGCWVSLACFLFTTGDLWLEVDAPRQRLVTHWFFFGESIPVAEEPCDIWGAVVWGALEELQGENGTRRVAWLCAVTKKGQVLSLVSCPYGEGSAPPPPPAEAQTLAAHLDLPLMCCTDAVPRDGLWQALQHRGTQAFQAWGGPWGGHEGPPPTPPASLPPVDLW